MKPDTSRPPPVPPGGFREFSIEEIEQSVPSRFEEEVARHGRRLAVKTRRHALTYEALNRLANRIAWAILETRGGGEEPAALLFEPGAPMVAAILGALKAGKIYMALDSSDPRPRTAAMLEDAGAELIVTDAGSRPLAESWKPRGGRVIEVDEIGQKAGDENPGLSISPDARAYIFYTSGSTGRPKGVVDTHRNVLHNILRYTNSLFLGPEDRLSLLQSCAFSGSVSSLFGALLNGAAVFPFDPRGEGARALSAWLRDEGITVYHSVPAIFRSLEDADGGFPDLRVIRLEGDQASWRDVEIYKKRFSSRSVLVNGLGATETGLTRQFFISHATEAGGGAVPVGYPVRDMEVTILDEAGLEAGKDRVGEIAVRSRYLAPGYWRRPDLDRAFFTEANGAGERTYRTGDRGRLRSDGCLEYLGRKDFLPKIRGHRIAAAEVEAALLGIEGIRQAVVVGSGNGTEEPRLIAHLVVAGSRPSADGVRRVLAQTLPDYMVPAVFSFAKSLPLDPNGKVDRRALREARVETSAAFLAPRDPVERRLADIVEEVLGRGPIGVRDDFFELGVDSLPAARVAARARRAFGGDISLATLFRAQTVERLARAICEGETENSAALDQESGSRTRTLPDSRPISK